VRRRPPIYAGKTRRVRTMTTEATSKAAGDAIATITGFPSFQLFDRFALPRTCD